MDKTIHKHLDNRDALHEEVKKDFDGIVSQLSLDDILQNPEQTLMDFAEEVGNDAIIKYAPLFIEEGQRFAKDIMAKRIVVDKTKDPNFNKEEFE